MAAAGERGCSETAPGARPRGRHGAVLQGDHLVSLRALGALGLGEFDPLAVAQRAVAFTDDGTEMDEEVFAILTLDESKALCVVEPFHGSSLSFRHVLHSSTNDLTRSLRLETNDHDDP